MRYVFFLLLIILFWSCSGNKPLSLSEYMQWLNHPENGLVARRYVNGMEIVVKYLPAELLACQEVKKSDKAVANYDSLRNYYKQSLTFLMSIGPDERKGGGDVMMSGIAGYREYAERSHTMNFDMQEYVTLIAESGEYRPVLSSLENIYGLGNKRNILFVFVPGSAEDKSLYEEQELDFVYADELFGLGTHHFLFKRSDIVNIPSLKISE